jgi:hypothetical protein
MYNTAPTATDRELVRLRAEAMHATNRLALYKAKLYGRPTTTEDGSSRLRELERVREGASRRLRQALAAKAQEGEESAGG